MPPGFTYGDLKINKELTIIGSEVTVAAKYMYKVYIKDADGEPIFKIQTYYWNGSSFVATTGIGFGASALYNNTGVECTATGASALYNNTGASCTAMGRYALYNNTGASCTAMGRSALYNNTGVECTATGASALYNNTGAYCTATGVSALYNNTGVSCTAMGVSALYNNTGAYCTATGVSALYNNTGVSCTAMGRYALSNNTGVSCTAMGRYALYNNTGVECTAMGVSALYNNTGAYCTATGASALYKNNWPNRVAIGYISSPAFTLDISTTKNFVDTDITTNTITFSAAHGFGTIGTKVNLWYDLLSGAAPTGLVDNTIYQFTITSATVLTLTGIASNGTGTYSLTKNYDLTNTISIGVDVQATKANQVLLGNSSIVETLLQGNVGIGGTPNANIILDVASTTKALRLPVMTSTQKTAIASPVEGMEVYDSTLHKKCVYTTTWETITSA